MQVGYDAYSRKPVNAFTSQTVYVWQGGVTPNVQARRIGVVLHRMWRNETEFRFARDVVTTATGV